MRPSKIISLANPLYPATPEQLENPMIRLTAVEIPALKQRQAAEKFIAENGDKVGDDVKSQVQADVDALKSALEGDDNDAVRWRVRRHRKQRAVSSASWRSIALLTSCDFGNPDPYTHAIISRISKPASSMRTHIRCCVRVPANARRCPPGFRTRLASR